MGGTWLEDRNREKAREAAEDARLARALEAQDETDFIVRYGPAFREAGHCLVDDDGSERERVEVIIKRDRTDRLIEMDRQVAEVEVANGNYYNLVGSALPPTPEWLAKHETMPFTPKQADDTVRVIKTVRVVRTPIVARLWRAGKITDDQFRACLWYRKVHEQAGLEGRYSGMKFDKENMGGGSSRSSGGAGHIPLTMEEAFARRMFRAAQEYLPSNYLVFFEKVVIDDVSLNRASRFARCRNERAPHHFRTVAQCLAAFCDANGVDMACIGRD